MKTTMKSTKIRLFSLDYFEYNFYQDPEGDWWENKKNYIRYKESINDTHYNANKERFLFTGDDRLRFGEITDAKNANRRNWHWAVEEYITQETHPEYYL